MKTFKKVVISFAFAINTGSIAIASTQDIASKANEYINAHVAQNKFSGTVLLAKEGTILFTKAYGMTDYEQKIENTIETKFRIGSITKQFTAMAIMMLQEKGLLNIQDTVSKYIPDFPHGNEITIHHLLTHSSGILNYTSLKEFIDNITKPITLDDLIKLFKDKPLDFEIGKKFSYSNSGYVLLTFIIEKVSEISYEAFLNKNIFEPLEMSSTGYYHNENPPKNESFGYTINETENIIKAENWHMSQAVGAGALYSTVEDLFIWDQALYTEKLVSQKSLDLMFTKYYSYDNMHIGYGWVIGEILEKMCIGHAGGLNGFITQILRFVNEDICIIVLSNLDVSSIETISKDLIAIIFD